MVDLRILFEEFKHLCRECILGTVEKGNSPDRDKPRVLFILKS
jgi:hypothetical protein